MGEREEKKRRAAEREAREWDPARREVAAGRTVAR
uniref:Uncharacterized protein n=1 Tax=Arundo donax TaxID=35708 RepID=A0A0A8Z6Q6_ARUDO